jgi:hypothetical protein
MKSIPLKVLAFAMVLMFGAILLSPGARAKDRLLDEVVEFTGELLFLETKVPGLVIGAVRNGEPSVAGFGQVSPETRWKDTASDWFDHQSVHGRCVGKPRR